MPRVIAEAETRKLIDMTQALRVVEQMFRYRASGKVLSLPRRRLSGRRRQLNVMAAWQADWELMGLRAYMGGANTITLYDGRSGEMILVLNARYLSSLRTGAASGVAAKYLARLSQNCVNLGHNPGMVIEISNEERLPSKNEAAHLTELSNRDVNVVRIDWHSRTTIGLNGEDVFL